MTDFLRKDDQINWTTVGFWVITLSWLPVIFVLYRHNKWVHAFIAFTRMVATLLLILCRLHGRCLFSDSTSTQYRQHMQSQWFAIAVQLLSNKLKTKWQFLQFIVIDTGLILRDLFITGPDNVMRSITIEFALAIFIIPLNWWLSGEPVPYKTPSFLGINFIVFMAYIISLTSFQLSPRLAVFVWQYMFMMSVMFVFLAKATLLPVVDQRTQLVDKLPHKTESILTRQEALTRLSIRRRIAWPFRQHEDSDSSEISISEYEFSEDEV